MLYSDIARGCAQAFDTLGIHSVRPAYEKAGNRYGYCALSESTMARLIENLSRKACDSTESGTRVTNLRRLTLYLFLRDNRLIIGSEAMKKKSNRNNSLIRCPYCGGTVVFRSADGIYKDNNKNVMLYVCSHYPECDAYVRVHPGTKIPMGTMADHKLRALRNITHQHFDKLFKDGYMTRHEAYMWLANLISAPLSQAHIGYLGEYYCNLVIKESDKLLRIKQR